MTPSFPVSRTRDSELTVRCEISAGDILETRDFLSASFSMRCYPGTAMQLFSMSRSYQGRRLKLAFEHTLTANAFVLQATGAWGVKSRKFPHPNLQSLQPRTKQSFLAPTWPNQKSTHLPTLTLCKGPYGLQSTQAPNLKRQACSGSFA